MYNNWKRLMSVTQQYLTYVTFHYITFLSRNYWSFQSNKTIACIEFSMSVHCLWTQVLFDNESVCFFLWQGFTNFNFHSFEDCYPSKGKHLAIWHLNAALCSPARGLIYQQSAAGQVVGLSELFLLKIAACFGWKKGERRVAGKQNKLAEAVSLLIECCY